MANNAESGLKHQEAIKPKSGLSSHENGRNLYFKRFSQFTRKRFYIHVLHF